MSVTIVKIAEYLGISKSTVSRAIKGSRNVSPQTRRKVLETVQKLNYRPDPFISRLMQQRRQLRPLKDHGVLAAVYISKDGANWAEKKAYRPYLVGMWEQSQKQGFRVDCFWSDASLVACRRLFSQLKARGIEGIIFMNPLPDKLSRIPLASDFFAGVYLGHGSNHPDLHRVDVDHQGNMNRIWKKAREEGHRRIGFATSRALTDQLRGVRISSFEYCQREVGSEDRIPVIEFDSPIRAEQVAEWASNEKLEALLFGNEEIAAEIKCLRPASNVYCLDIENGGNGIRGINVQPEALGATVVNVLIAQINCGERGEPDHPQRIYIKGEWVD